MAVTGAARGERFVLGARELNGALGDLGTLLPLTLGAIAVAGLAATPVLLGFALFYIATGLYYRLPVPVQPMKAVAAVLLTAPVSAPELAASGVIMGLALLLLGVTGWITHLSRIVPQPVLSGLQLGLGLALAMLSLPAMAGAPLVAAISLGLLLALPAVRRVPSVPVALAVAAILGGALDAPGTVLPDPASFALAVPPLPSVSEWRDALARLALPQLSLTLTNAVLLTALIAGDYFGERAAHVTPGRLSVSSGLANLLLVPLGALPMCHGAGGLAAHHRFGARSGTAPVALGLAILLLALLPGAATAAALAAVPAAALGALLLVAAGELMALPRLRQQRASRWPVIGLTAGLTLWLDPFLGLVGGCAAELIRRRLTRPRADGC